MKLSELFKTPFKVKGGGVLNLRGFSKRVVDKEIEGSGGGSVKFPIGEKILNLLDEDLVAHPSKFAEDPENNDTIIDISEIDSIPQGYVTIYFLYKKSDIDAVSKFKTIIYQFSISETTLSYEASQIDGLAKKIYIIDNIPYYALYVGMV